MYKFAKSTPVINRWTIFADSGEWGNFDLHVSSETAITLMVNSSFGMFGHTWYYHITSDPIELLSRLSRESVMKKFLTDWEISGDRAWALHFWDELWHPFIHELNNETSYHKG